MAAVNGLLRWIKERSSSKRIRKQQSRSDRLQRSKNDLTWLSSRDARDGSCPDVERNNMKLPPPPRELPNLPDVSRECAVSPAHIYDEIPAYAVDSRRDVLRHMQMDMSHLDFHLAREYGAYLVVPIRERSGQAWERSDQIQERSGHSGSRASSGTTRSVFNLPLESTRLESSQATTKQMTSSADQLDRLVCVQSSLDHLDSCSEDSGLSSPSHTPKKSLHQSRRKPQPRTHHRGQSHVSEKSTCDLGIHDSAPNLNISRDTRNFSGTDLDTNTHINESTPNLHTREEVLDARDDHFHCRKCERPHGMYDGVAFTHYSDSDSSRSGYLPPYARERVVCCTDDRWSNRVKRTSVYDDVDLDQTAADRSATSFNSSDSTSGVESASGGSFITPGVDTSDVIMDNSFFGSQTSSGEVRPESETVKPKIQPVLGVLALKSLDAPHNSSRKQFVDRQNNNISSAAKDPVRREQQYDTLDMDKIKNNLMLEHHVRRLANETDNAADVTDADTSFLDLSGDSLTSVTSMSEMSAFGTEIAHHATQAAGCDRGTGPTADGGRGDVSDKQHRPVTSQTSGFRPFSGKPRGARPLVPKKCTLQLSPGEAVMSQSSLCIDPVDRLSCRVTSLSNSSQGSSVKPLPIVQSRNPGGQKHSSQNRLLGDLMRRNFDRQVLALS